MFSRFFILFVTFLYFLMGGVYLGYDIGIDFVPETVVSTKGTGSRDCRCLLPESLPLHPISFSHFTRLDVALLV